MRKQIPEKVPSKLNKAFCLADMGLAGFERLEGLLKVMRRLANSDDLDSIKVLLGEMDAIVGDYSNDFDCEFEDLRTQVAEGRNA